MKLLLSFAVLLFVGGTFCQGQNLISNGGFEHQLTGWKATKGTGMVSVSANGRKGGKALLISDDDSREQVTILGNDIPVSGGGKYQLSFWARIGKPQPSENNPVRVELMFIGKDDNVLTHASSNNEIMLSVPADTADWKQFEWTGEAPAAATALCLFIHTSERGVVTADLDDFEFSAVKPVE